MYTKSSSNNKSPNNSNRSNTDKLSRLKTQIEFIVEIDKLKSIFRETRLMHEERLENDAEHSWHLALMVMVLHEYANTENADGTKIDLDIKTVLELALIHDIVEIDAGDVFSYSDHCKKQKYLNECKAADRIFNLLPDDQAKYFLGLWHRYESQECIESKFARVVDRLQPFLHNYYTDGYTWVKYGITVDRVRDHIFKDMKPGSEVLWKFVDDLLAITVEKGMLLPEQKTKKDSVAS